MEERMVKVQELAMMIDTSAQTISSWYRWKAKNPEHELAKLLPEYTRIEGCRRTRFWKESEVWRLAEFKRSIPQGRNGLMGEVTQKYVTRGRDEKGYIKSVADILSRHNVDSEVIGIITEFLDDDYCSRHQTVA